MHKKIFFSIIVLQITCIVYICFMMYTKYTSQSIAISPIQKNTIQLSPTDKLQYFFEPKPNITIIEPYYKDVSLSTAPKYSINNDALNERFSYPIQKDKNTFRIITLGDSFTYGLYVDTKNNWPEQLEDMLHTMCKNDKKYEVINLAVSNYDIQYSLERLKQRGVKYNPDLVIWFVKYDDFSQINEIILPLRRDYYKKMKISEGLDKDQNNGTFWPYAQEVMKQFEEKYSAEQILTKQQEILQSIHTVYTDDLLMVLLDMEPRRHKIFLDTFAKNRPNTFIYNQLPDFSRLPDRHPDVKGHTEIAKNIFTYLMKSNISVCN